MTTSMVTTIRRTSALVLAAALSWGTAAHSAELSAAAWDLHFKEATYQALQQKYFSGLTLLGRLSESAPAERAADLALTQAGLYLGYGLPDQAGLALNQLHMQRTLPDRAWLNLAQMFYQRGHLPQAEETLSRLTDVAPGRSQTERDYLLGLVLLARDRDREAVAALRGLQGQSELSAYGRYNLAIGLAQTKRSNEALTLFEQLASTPSTHSAVQALQDRINLALGHIYLQLDANDHARKALKRIDSAGPLRDQARLGLGWTAYKQRNYRAAMESWSPLAQAPAHEPAGHEAYLGLARAHYELGEAGKAAELYQRAIAAYDHEAGALDLAAVQAIEHGLLDRLLRDEPGMEVNWYWRPATAPQHPAITYLIPLLASHPFQEGLKHYRDLRYLHDQLSNWKHDLHAFQNLLDLRRDAHWQRLPSSLEQSKQFDVSKPEAAAQQLRDELRRVEITGDPSPLAKDNEQKLLSGLQRVQDSLNRLQGLIAVDELQDKYRLLRGLMIWDLVQVYPQRLWDTKKAFIDLDKTLARAGRSQAMLHKSAELAAVGIVTNDQDLEQMAQRRRELTQRTETLLGEQRRYLEAQLRQTLATQRSALKAYLADARLGLAQSLDRLASDTGQDDYKDTIVAYRDYAEFAPLSPHRRAALLRLAHLEMTQADAQYSQLVGKLEGEGRTLVKEAESLYEAAITRYQELLTSYSDQPDNDRVLYQLAKAYDHSGDTVGLLDTLERLALEFPTSVLSDEVQFRRGELLFALGVPDQAAAAYGTVVVMGPSSPYFEKAQYKHGWSMYRLGNYATALESFMKLLDRKLEHTDAVPTAGDEELLNDVLRVSSLGLSQINGAQSIARYIERVGPRKYEDRLYAALAELYMSQERIQDAAATYQAFVARRPTHPRAPEFQTRVMTAYQQGGFADLLIDAKQAFVTQYEPGSDYWKTAPASQDRATLLAQVNSQLHELAQYAHAKAQKSKQPADYRATERWYRLLLNAFPQDASAPETHFLLAELLYETGRYPEAIEAYEHTAYEYATHEKGAEAGYAALLTYRKLESQLSDAESAQWRQRALTATERFAHTYPQDPRIAATLTNAAQERFASKDLALAESLAQRVLTIDPPAEPALRRNAWTILAHGRFDTARYEESESAYSEALQLTAKGDAARPAMRERLAAAIYKQAETARDAGDLSNAVAHFQRLGKIVPESSARPSADFDAATALLTLQDTPAAIKALERFRKDYPNHELQRNVDTKLALAYQEIGDWRKAATELERLAEHGESEELRRDAIWQSAEMYVRAERRDDAIRVFTDYVSRYPAPLQEAVEGMQRIAELYAQQTATTKQHSWLQRIIDADQRGGAARTERTRYLAAHATFTLAEAGLAEFKDATLTHPLNKSLKVKKTKMEASLAAYKRAAEYGIGDITTAATYRIAQIYGDFSTDLMNSERPKGLNELELEQYDILLEEQAYPFEEQAIALHESNAQRTAKQNLYDEWVQKSYAALSKLMPARYGKQEQGELYIDAIY